MDAKLHPSAIVETGVVIGTGTSVWDHVHIRGPDTQIGVSCIIGGKTYIAPEVSVGDRVKINANVYLCTGVTLEDGVMVAAGSIFTNDMFPRATTPDLARLRPSHADENTLATFVREGATIGAGCVIGCGLTIGRFAMIGMGSVVTRSIPDFALAVGNPARLVGFVDRAGRPFARFEAIPERLTHRCADGYQYRLVGGQIVNRHLADG